MEKCRCLLCVSSNSGGSICVIDLDHRFVVVVAFLIIFKWFV